ncbi:MAG: pyruvate dehydrogenase (acetyl-transferring) E1 component subunit alpha [Anaerolineae bacterium]
MPRKQIDLALGIDHLSILDEDGKLDQALEPDISEDLLLRLHYAMLLARRFDKRMLNLQRQGRIGTFAPIEGQEAAQIGAVAVLRPSDWLVQAFRETGAALWRGQKMEDILVYYGGFIQAGEVPEDIHDLPVAIPVGTQITHGVGLAYGMKYRQTEDLAMVFFGDGATSEGDFHEGLNSAAVFQCPVVFVCQNNQWAISVPRSHQTRAQTLAQKALAYGMPGIQVDGNDVLAVYSAAQEAAQRARSGDGPTLIECVTYRMSVHTTADDPTKYRTDEEVETWQKRDPISRFQTYLKDKGLLEDDDIEDLEEQIKGEIAQAVDEAEARMEALQPDALEMFNHMYADMPPYLDMQRESLTQELASQEVNDG